MRAGFRESNKPRASNREGPYHSSVCKGKGRGSYCELAGVLGVAEGGWTGDVTLERETQLLPNHGRAEIINTPDSLLLSCLFQCIPLSKSNQNSQARELVDVLN